MDLSQLSEFQLKDLAPPVDQQTFENKLVEWESESKKHQERLVQSQKRLELAQVELNRAGKVPASFVPLSAGVSEKATLQKPFAGVVPEVDLLKTEIWAKAKQTLIQETYEFNRSEIFTSLYGGMPLAIRTGKLTSANEILERLKVIDLNQQDINLVRNIAEDMLKTIPQIGTEEPEKLPSDAEQPLVAPTGFLARPAGFSKLTVDAIIKQLTKPNIPPEVKGLDWDPVLSGEVEDSADIGTIKHLEQQADEFLKELDERNNMIASFKANVDNLPDLTLKDMFVDMVTMPGLAIAEVMQGWFEHTSQPLSGGLYRFLIPDLDALYKENMASGMSWRQASVKAWQEWDAPFSGAPEFILKYMLMELPFDPLTYVGWGIFTHLTKGMGTFGRFVGSAERGFISMTNAPIDALKWMNRAQISDINARLYWSGGKFITGPEYMRLHPEGPKLLGVYWGKDIIPKTAAQISSGVQKRFITVIKQAMEKWSEERGRRVSFRNISPEHRLQFVTAALNYVEKHPYSETYMANAGRELMAHNPIIDAQVRKLATSLKTKLAPEEITTRTIFEVNELLEDFLTGVNRSPKVMGDKLLGVLSATVDKEGKIVKLAERFFTGQQKSIRESAIRAFSGDFSTPATVLRFGNRVYDISQAIQKSEVALHRFESGRALVLFDQTKAEWQRMWAKYIDAFLVKPFAQSYLVFASYGFNNIFEDMVRSAFGGVFPHRFSSPRFERFFRTLRYDPDLTRGAISDMYGFLGSNLAEELRDNWVLTLSTLPLSLPTFGITAALRVAGRNVPLITPKTFARGAYAGMVWMPGAIGMDFRRNFVMRKAKQLLVQNGGEPVARLLNLATEFKGISKSLDRDITDYVTDAVLTGDPDVVLDGIKLFTRKNIHRGEIQKIEIHYPELSNTSRQKLLDRFDDGSLYVEVGTKRVRDAKGRFTSSSDSVDRVMKEIATDEESAYLRSPELGAKQFQHLVDTLSSFEVTNPEMAAQYIKNLNFASKVLDLTPKQVLAEAVRKSRGLPLEQRNQVIDDVLDKIAEFRKTGREQIEKLAEKTSLTLTKPESMIDWNKVTWGSGITPKLQSFIKETIDNLPIQFKSSLKSIDIDPQLPRPGRYEPITGTITFKGANVVRDKVTLYHELAHGIVRDNPEIINPFVRLFAGKPIPEMGFEEMFANLFSDWLVGGEAKVGKTFNDMLVDLFPKTQRTLPLGQEYITTAEQLTNLQVAKHLKLTDIYEEFDVWRRNHFASIDQSQWKNLSYKQRFWDDFYAGVDDLHRKIGIATIEADTPINRAMEELGRLGGNIPPVRPPVVVTGNLAVEDVAKLVGLRGDDLSRAILDSMSFINDKDMFVAYIRSHVRDIDKGFEKEAIEQVYDHLVYDLLGTTDAVTWLTSRKVMLESLRKELHQLHMSKMLPPEQVKSIEEYFTKTARSLRTEVYETVAADPVIKAELARYPKTIRDKVKSITEVKGGADVSTDRFGNIRLDYGDIDNLDSQLAHEVGHLRYSDVDVESKFQTFMQGDLPPTIATELYSEAFEEFVTGKPPDFSRVPKTLRAVPFREVNPSLVDKAIEFIKSEGIKVSSRKPLPKAKPIKRALYSNYDQMRQQSLDDATQWYYREFTDYSNANVFDSMMKSILPYWCVPEYATILSRVGWKHYKELVIGEDVLVVDPNTMVTRWEPLQDIAEFDYDGDLMVIPAKGKDLEFTPNHRWLVVDKLTGNHKHIKRGYQLSDGSDVIPRSLPHEFPSNSILTPRDAAILGWCVTDGYVNRGKYMIIYQSLHKYLLEIQELTGVRGRPRVRTGYSTSNSHDFTIRVAYDDSKRILGVCHNKSYLPELVTRLSQEAARAMWDAMFKAEGYAGLSPNGKDNYCWKQNPGPVMEAFQILSVLLGKAITVKDNRVNILNNSEPYLGKEARRLTTKNYKGKIWCPVTPSGTWFMNCNGSVVPTGNTYESQRWLWLPKTFVQHPAVLGAIGRWNDYSDDGYTRVANTDVEIKPGAGTVFGPLVGRLLRRDYPEYYDRLPVGGLVEFSDFMGRYGFYSIGIPSLTLAAMGGREQQFGEVAPAAAKTFIDGMTAMFPKSKFIKGISDLMFNDRFRDYLTAQEVTKMGGDGNLILAKLKQKEPLSTEEQDLWDSSRGEISWFLAMNEQMGMFRLRPKEREELEQNASKAIEEMFGIPKEKQDWYRAHGKRIGDIVGGLSYKEQDALKALNIYAYAGANRALLPGYQQDLMEKVELAWDRVTRFTESTKQATLGLETEFLSGILSGGDYLARLNDLQDDRSDFIYREMKNQLLDPIPEGLTPEEEEEWVNENSMMSIYGRKEYYKRFNVPVPVIHPIKELASLYFSIKLRDIYDPETGQKVRDWDNFWAQRQAVDDSIPDRYRDEWEELLSRNSTPLMVIRREIGEKYFRPYNKLWDGVLRSYPDNEQRLVKEYLYLRDTKQQLDRQAEIQSMVSAKTGNLLVSSFTSEVSNARKALRMANPVLDAWLYYWGRTSSFTTPEAEAAYIRIAKQTGRKI